MTASESNAVNAMILVPGQACRSILAVTAVVDRNGDLQVFARDDNAAEHTIEAARQKAYTAAAFGANMSDLVERADENGLHRLPGTLFMPVGVPAVRQHRRSAAPASSGRAGILLPRLTPTQRHSRDC